MVGFLDAYVLFDDERYWDGFTNVWDFVSQHMITPAVGEWYTLLTRTGEPLVTQLGNEWKTAYHTGRSMLECVERLDGLQQRASADNAESGTPLPH